MTGGDLQSNVFDQLLERFGANGGFLSGADLDQNADFSAGVDIGGNHAVAGDLHTGVAWDLDVFPDFRDHAYSVRFEVGFGIGRESFGHVIGKGLEHVVAGDKIRLAIHLG